MFHAAFNSSHVASVHHTGYQSDGSGMGGGYVPHSYQPPPPKTGTPQAPLPHGGKFQTTSEQQIPNRPPFTPGPYQPPIPTRPGPDYPVIVSFPTGCFI